MRILTEDEFYEIFKPIPSKNHSDFWDRPEVEGIPVEFVWAAMDGDDGSTIVVPGWHVVNVFGWMVTAMPWTTTDLEVHFDDGPVGDPDDEWEWDNQDEDD